MLVDSVEFARGSRQWAGKIALSQLPRLVDVLADCAGELEVRLDGSRDDDGGLWLDLSISGRPSVCCQRCLGGIDFPLQIESRLKLVLPGKDWPDDDLTDDSCDAIAADEQLRLFSLVEDEVLLALPIAPRHEQCDPPKTAENEQGLTPFAVLAALKKR